PTPAVGRSQLKVSSADRRKNREPQLAGTSPRPPPRRRRASSRADVGGAETGLRYSAAGVGGEDPTGCSQTRQRPESARIADSSHWDTTGGSWGNLRVVQWPDPGPAAVGHDNDGTLEARGE